MAKYTGNTPITLQTGIREYNGDLSQYTGMLGGLTPDIHTLRSLNPLTTNRVICVMYRGPYFMQQYFKVDNNEYNGVSAFMTYKKVLEYNNQGIQINMGDGQLGPATLQGGFAGRTISIPTTQNTQQNQTLTITVSELCGRPISTFHNMWVDGIADPITGLCTYHGLVAGSEVNGINQRIFSSATGANETALEPLKIVHKDGDLKNCAASNLSWEEDVEIWVYAKCPRARKDGTIAQLYPGRYRVSNHGRVWSNQTKSFMSTRVDEYDNCIKVDLTYVRPDNSTFSCHVKLHRLLADSFDLPNKSEERCQINHINGIRTDFNLKNLEWTTSKENVVHAFKTQLEVNPAGEAHPRAKFTNHQRECYYEIMITLKDIEPYKVAEIIASRLPAITKDDVKYAKQVLKKQRGVIFPLLDFRHPHKYTQEESDELYEIANKIFDKYNIKEKEGYVNEHRKKYQG